MYVNCKHCAKSLHTLWEANNGTCSDCASKEPNPLVGFLGSVVYLVAGVVVLFLVIKVLSLL